MPIILGSLGQTLWSSGTRKSITATCGMISAICLAIGAIKAEAGDINYVFSIPHEYIKGVAAETLAEHIKKDEENDKAMKLAQAEVQRVVSHMRSELNDGKREATENDLFKAGLEMKKAEKANDEETQQYIQKEVIRLQSTLQKLEEQSKSLNKSD